MATKKTVWVSKDHQQWETEARADRQDEILAIGSLLEKRTVYGNLDAGDMLGMLTTDSALAVAVIKFHAKYGTKA